MIDAERVRGATREVLGRPEYDDLDRSLPEEWLDRLRSALSDLLDQILGSGAAGGVGRIIAFVLVGALVVAAVVLLLGVRRGRSVEAVVDVDTSRDARSWLVAADEARAAGDLESAVRARYGALVLALIEAGVLGAQPGLTVGEVDDAVAEGVPTAAGPAAAAGQVLADVVYGDLVPGTAEDDRVAAGLDAIARATGRRDLEASGRTTDPVGVGSGS